MKSLFYLTLNMTRFFENNLKLLFFKLGNFLYPPLRVHYVSPGYHVEAPDWLPICLIIATYFMLHHTLVISN